MRRGFTLVELMAAVLISSIVVLAAYSLMSGSTGTFKDQDDRRFLEALSLRITVRCDFVCHLFQIPHQRH